MIALAPGYNAVRWTGEKQMIRALDWAPLINRVYTRNPTTGNGFVGNTKGDLFPTLTAFEPGVDYLIDMLGSYDLMRGTLAPTGAFAAFDGYTPVESGISMPDPVTPGSIPGTVNSQIAAAQIIGGTLVARLAQGLVPYSTATTNLRYLLFGFALNSAGPGETVQVQRNGYVTYPGLGLTPGATLFAGDNGQLVYSNEGMAVHHVVGRAETDDSFSFSSSYTTISL